MSGSMENKRILITRPKQQAQRLIELVSASGATPIAFPTIEIKPIESSSVFNNIEQYDQLIFISRNAVDLAFDLYLLNEKLPENIEIFAVGAGTAEELTEKKVLNVIHTGSQADSESLLQCPALQAELVAGKQILIVKGVGGRKLLADTLIKRGANVRQAEIYQRCLPQYEIADIKNIWHKNKPDVIITTSAEGLSNLVALTIKEYQAALFNTPLLLMSARHSELAKELGFVADMLVVKERSDAGLLSTLLEIVGDEK